VKVHRFNVWGVTGSLTVASDDVLEFAIERLEYWLAEINAAANRFIEDSEITRLNRSFGAPMHYSPTFELCLNTAMTAYEQTKGACSPTVLPSLLALGYDRDYSEIASDPSIEVQPTLPSLGLETIHLDTVSQTVQLSDGCQLDFGATAKALTCDLVANDIAEVSGIVVEIGGDVAVRGQGPDGFWAIAVSDSLEASDNDPRVGLTNAGVATSSCAIRVWQGGGHQLSHIIDPFTGRSVEGPYNSASVVAASCVEANAFSTAALVWGEDASYYIAQAGLAARLVRTDGNVDLVGAWPREEQST
jgi:FAD:protein FMN transferase